MQIGDIADAKREAQKRLNDAKQEYVKQMQLRPEQRHGKIVQDKKLFDQMIKRYGVERVMAWMKQYEAGASEVK